MVTSSGLVHKAEGVKLLPAIRQILGDNCSAKSVVLLLDATTAAVGGAHLIDPAHSLAGEVMQRRQQQRGGAERAHA